MVNIKIIYKITILIFRQIVGKLQKKPVACRVSMIEKPFFFKIQLFFIFIRTMFNNNFYTINLCKEVITKLSSEGVTEVAVYGTGFIAEILEILLQRTSVKISDVYDDYDAGKKYLKFKVLPAEALVGFDAKIIIASLTGVSKKREALKNMGIPDENIINI